MPQREERTRSIIIQKLQNFDLVSRLRNHGAVTAGADVSGMKALLSEGHAALKSCDKEIARLFNLIDEIKEERAFIQTRVDGLQSVLAPITLLVKVYRVWDPYNSSF